MRPLPQPLFPPSPPVPHIQIGRGRRLDRTRTDAVPQLQPAPIQRLQDGVRQRIGLGWREQFTGHEHAEHEPARLGATIVRLHDHWIVPLAAPLVYKQSTSASPRIPGHPGRKGA